MKTSLGIVFEPKKMLIEPIFFIFLRLFSKTDLMIFLKSNIITAYILYYNEKKEAIKSFIIRLIGNILDEYGGWVFQLSVI